MSANNTRQKQPVSPVSPNPSGARVAQLARTSPPNPNRARLNFGGGRLDRAEWLRLTLHLLNHPDARMVRGEQRMPGENLYFIGYNPSYPDGERWGTKEQLAEIRRKGNAASRRQKRERMKNDPDYKAAMMRRLARLVTRRVAIEESDDAAAELKRQKAAARQSKFRAAEKARKAKAHRDAITKVKKGNALTRMERAAIHRAEVDAERAARRASCMSPG